MQNIIIDEEFRQLLPTLDKVTFESLENSLLAHGARDPLVLWQNILIDGYNRYRICTEHDIPFTTVSMEFDSRDEVLHWIIENQIARRNLSPVELSHFRGLYFNAAKRMRGSNNQYPGRISRPQNGGVETSSLTAREIGKRFNVSKNTIERDGMVANALNAIAEISPEAKRKILSGEVPFNRVKLQCLSKASKEEIEEVVDQILKGTYNRDDHRKKRGVEPTQEQGDTDSTTPLPKQTEAGYVDTIVSLITGNLNTALKSLTNYGGVSELKISLRTLISSLEELYDSIVISE